MEKSNQHEIAWDNESALTRKIAGVALLATGGLALSGRINAAAKMALVSGGSFILSEVERRIARKINGE